MTYSMARGQFRLAELPPQRPSLSGETKLRYGVVRSHGLVGGIGAVMSIAGMERCLGRGVQRLRFSLE